MKLKLWLLIAVIVFNACSGYAAVSVDQTLTKEYLMNNGYSSQIYNTVNVGRARALGDTFYSEEEKAHENLPPVKKILRKIQAYFDPAIDDYSFYHHDITTEPTYNDL